MKGKIFAMVAVFAMMTVAFSAIGVSALETNVSALPIHTHWYTGLDGNAKIVGNGKPVEGTAHTYALKTMNIPCSGVANFITIETEDYTDTYGLTIETVTYNDNAQTLTVKFTEGTLHNGKVTDVETYTQSYTSGAYVTRVTRTTYTVTGMTGMLTFDDGMTVKLSGMNGAVTYEAWYQTQTLDKLDGIEDGVSIEL